MKTSGTMTGHYHAVVIFERGITYKETTIDWDFIITSGDAKHIIGVSRETFQADPNTGGI